MKQHFLIKVLEWAEKKNNGFRYHDLERTFDFKDWQWSTLHSYFNYAFHNHRSDIGRHNHARETIFQQIDGDGDVCTDTNNIYTLTPNAYFIYIEYLGIKEARENAESARRYSMFSIVIALLALLVPLYLVQTVKLSDRQIEEIKTSLQPTLDSGSSPE